MFCNRFAILFADVRVPLAGAVLNVWDLGGQAELRPLWHSYLAECHALIFVVDSSDVQRLPEVCSALGGGIDKAKKLGGEAVF